VRVSDLWGWGISPRGVYELGEQVELVRRVLELGYSKCTICPTATDFSDTIGTSHCFFRT
jgi:hypothetical protein